MTIFKQILFCLILCLCTVIPQTSFAEESNEKAARYLFDQIVTAQVYNSWTNPKQCLGIKTESYDSDFFDFAVYEKHSSDCHGDPATQPIVDRFRVSRSKKILWHNIANDQYLPFKQFVASRKVIHHD